MRLLAISLLFSIFISSLTPIEDILGKLSDELAHLNIPNTVYLLVYSSFWYGFLSIIVYEFLIYPLVRNKFPSILKRISVVTLMMTLSSFFLFYSRAGSLFVSLQWNHNRVSCSSLSSINNRHSLPVFVDTRAGVHVCTVALPHERTDSVFSFAPSGCIRLCSGDIRLLFYYQDLHTVKVFSRLFLSKNYYLFNWISHILCCGSLV